MRKGVNWAVFFRQKLKTDLRADFSFPQGKRRNAEQNAALHTAQDELEVRTIKFLGRRGSE